VDRWVEVAEARPTQEGIGPSPSPSPLFSSMFCPSGRSMQLWELALPPVTVARLAVGSEGCHVPVVIANQHFGRRKMPQSGQFL
jgi:hypothetical protein